MHATISPAKRLKRMRLPLFLLAGVFVAIGMSLESAGIRLSSFLSGLFLLAALLGLFQPAPDSPGEP
jgi:hypothetical protein